MPSPLRFARCPDNTAIDSQYRLAIGFGQVQFHNNSSGIGANLWQLCVDLGGFIGKFDRRADVVIASLVLKPHAVSGRGWQ